MLPVVLLCLATRTLLTTLLMLNPLIRCTNAHAPALVQLDSATATFLLLCRCNGTIEVYSLPQLAYVAMFLSMHEGEKAVPATDPALVVCFRLTLALLTPCVS